jgi:hypothetical protein
MLIIERGRTHAAHAFTSDLDVVLHTCGLRACASGAKLHVVRLSCNSAIDPPLLTLSTCKQNETHAHIRMCICMRQHTDTFSLFPPLSLPPSPSLSLHMCMYICVSHFRAVNQIFFDLFKSCMPTSKQSTHACIHSHT